MDRFIYIDTNDRRIARMCRRYKTGEYSLTNFGRKVRKILDVAEPDKKAEYLARVELEAGPVAFKKILEQA